MAKNNLFIIAAIALMIYPGCVNDPQDIPSELNTNPVFGISGSFGSEGLGINAGIDEWTVQPTVKEGESNIIYSALFSIDKCDVNCQPSLEFSFYRELPFTGDPNEDFQKTINPGPVAFVASDEERDSFNIILSTHPGLFMSGYSLWLDSHPPGTNVFPSYESIIGFEENLNVCFQSLAYTGCNYSQCISFDPSTLVPCLARIAATMEDERWVKLTVHPEGTSPFNIEWANGESSQNILVPFLQDSINEIFASVKVTDANGNFSDLKQTIRLQNGVVDACYFPITLMSESVNNSTPDFTAGKARITYTDENGIEWSSTAGVQSPQSFMNITNVDFFGLSPIGQTAHKVDLSTTVQLFNRSTGESKWLVLQNVTLPLSPQ